VDLITINLPPRTLRHRIQRTETLWLNIAGVRRKNLSATKGLKMKIERLRRLSLAAEDSELSFRISLHRLWKLHLEIDRLILTRCRFGDPVFMDIDALVASPGYLLRKTTFVIGSRKR
jgi:hypothetical protein